MFSLVIPAHNEAQRLAVAVLIAHDALKGVKHEIIIAEDGSTDETPQIAEKLAEDYSFVKHLHSKNKLGRGLALKNAFRQAKGTVVGYMDVDLATPPKYLKKLAEYAEDYDVVTGSRYLKESRAKRTGERLLFSSVYNFLVRLLFGSKLHDHQCGFKAFKKRVALKLCSEAEANHWFWDTEVLVLAQRHGMKVKEFPVEWIESSQDSKVRVLKDSLDMALQAAGLWKRLHFG